MIQVIGGTPLDQAMLISGTTVDPHFSISRGKKLGDKMNSILKCVAISAGLWFGAVAGEATDLTIHLTGEAPVSRRVVQFQCDSTGVQMGLPAGAFPVEYLDGDGNSLAVLPIGGRSLIFANVISASGARYAAGRYIWWDAGSRGVHLYSDFDSLDGKKQATCHSVSHPK
jgi:membrane-bound inhibitor of C-type lysozyme